VEPQGDHIYLSLAIISVTVRLRMLADMLYYIEVNQHKKSLSIVRQIPYETPCMMIQIITV